MLWIGQEKSGGKTEAPTLEIGLRFA